jgi:glycosyltransferase involved in cell wall biosynthesis
MRILFVIPGYSLGGTTSSLASLLNSDFSNKYDVEVFSINRRSYTHPSLIAYDIGLNGLTTAFNANFSAFRKIDRLKYLPIKFLKQFKPFTNCLREWVINQTVRKIESRKHYDYIVAFQEENTTKFTRHFTNPNKIAWVHCDYAKSFAEDVNEQELYNQYKKIVCVSDFTRKSFVGRYPSLKEKTFAIHNLFDAEKILEKAKASIDDVRFDDSHFTILSMGRISEVKRFYLIPEMAAKLKEAGVDFRWFILGGGNNGQDQKRVSDAIVQNEVENEVLCLGGKSNPYPYLKASDLLVSTSISEACPMVFNEAKLLHIPILSVDFGSAFEFVEQGKDGYISSIDEMPDMLLELAHNPQKLDSIKMIDSITDTNRTILRQLYSLFSD